MNEFRADNTSDYTAAQMAALNAELAARLAAAGLTEREDDAYQALVQAFADEVAQRMFEQISNNANAYHAWAIDHEQFSARQRELWDAARAADVADDVLRLIVRQE